MKTVQFKTKVSPAVLLQNIAAKKEAEYQSFAFRHKVAGHHVMAYRKQSPSR